VNLPPKKRAAVHESRGMDESSVVEQRTQPFVAVEAEAVNLCNKNRRDPLVSGSNPLGGAILIPENLLSCCVSKR
jgi:hypothetical protein